MKSQVQLHDKNFTLYISFENLQQRIRQMATQMDNDYTGKDIVFVAILNGAFMFAADLLKEIRTKCEIQFVKISSYAGLQSTGQIIQHIGLSTTLENKHVIIIEDIIDTGNTLFQFLPEIKKRNPASIKIATLLLKPAALKHELKIDYTGMEIPNDFIVGYGMDYNELGRNLKDIYVIK